MISKRSRIEKEILDEYLKKHRHVSDRQLKDIKEKIKRIDTKYYEELADYDAKTGITNKRAEYVNIMLKHYRKRPGENSKDYKARVYSEKDKLLAKHKLNTTSRKVKVLTFKGFGKEHGYGKIKVPNKEAVTKKMKTIKKSVLKSPKKFVNNIVDNLKPSKSKIHFTAPKGFFNKLKNWKEKNPTKFKKYRVRALIAAALISLSIGSVSIGNYYMNNIDQTPTQSSAEYYEPEEVDPSINQENNENDSKEETQLENSDSKENTEKDPEETIDESKQDNSEDTEKNISISSLAHSLILDSNIDFNTEFQIPEGLYYETPEGTGNYGNYTKFSDSKLKLTYIDAIYEDGRYVTYDANSGLSISDIIAQNPDAKLSYHVETTDGHILRMEFIYIK